MKHPTLLAHPSLSSSRGDRAFDVRATPITGIVTALALVLLSGCGELNLDTNTSQGAADASPSANGANGADGAKQGDATAETASGTPSAAATRGGDGKTAIAAGSVPSDVNTPDAGEASAKDPKAAVDAQPNAPTDGTVVPDGAANPTDASGTGQAAGDAAAFAGTTNEFSKRLHVAAYRDGAIQMFESGGTFVMGFENVVAAYDAEAKRVVLDWSELPGLATSGSIYGQWTSVQAVGGDPHADNTAWLVARSDVERAASELFNYTKVGGRWQRAKNREGMLAWSHRFYSTRSDGSVIAIKEWEVGDDAISLEYEDDSPKARKLWAKLEAEIKAHPVSVEVVHVNGTNTKAAPELPVVDAVTGFVVTTSGDAYATVRVTDSVDGDGGPCHAPMV